MRAKRFRALRHCLERLSPEEIIEEVAGERAARAGRGRLSHGIEMGRRPRAAGGKKYVICNGDEGDPGAFMDRMLLESFPYRVIEGMAIAARAVGADEGIFYIRAEYPLAVKRVARGDSAMPRAGAVGRTHFRQRFPPAIFRVKEGAGAFVCGEETALLAAFEGRRGTPRLRPPYPAERGLWGKPTSINNVETYALVPWIFRHGADGVRRAGHRPEQGHEGLRPGRQIRRGGLIEVPMGVTIRQIVEEIGGGVAGGKRFKAVQIGGPSGGCVPAELGRHAGRLRGPGRSRRDHGLRRHGRARRSDCMVDIARYFLRFTQEQSCGKCTLCRIGTRRMLDMLDRICTGRASAGDLEELESARPRRRRGSVCGLGRTAPNPVLSTLRYFRGEYEAHLAGRCPAGRCKALVAYRVTEDCIGCTLCAQHCPVEAIPMTPYSRHVIDLQKCTRCDACRQVCPAGAVVIQSPCPSGEG